MPAYAHRLAPSAPRSAPLESVVPRRAAGIQVLTSLPPQGGTSGFQSTVDAAARLGHSFDKLPVHGPHRPANLPRPFSALSRPGMAPAVNAAPPIQRLLGRKAFQTGTTGLAGPARNQVHAAIRNYNRGHDASDNSEAHLHQQLAALDAVEHHLYGLSHQVDFTNAAAGPRQSATAVSDLLNEVQAEHRSLIDRTVRHQRQLWVHGAVNPTERAAVNATWSSWWRATARSG